MSADARGVPAEPDLEAIRARWEKAFTGPCEMFSEAWILNAEALPYAPGDIKALLSALSSAREELRVTDALLAERQRVLDAIPTCPSHGPCVPHALEWIAAAVRSRAAVAPDPTQEAK